jgi:hypothetical protein
MKKITTLLLTSILTLPLCADVIVDYAPTVTADIVGVGLSSGNVAYSDSTARSPATGGDYTAGTSINFYGGTSTTGTGTINQWYAESDTDGYRFRLNASTVGDTASALFFWKQANFLNGTEAGVVTLDGSNAFSVTGRRYGSGTAGDIRFVVEESGSFYVSAIAGAVPDSSGSVTLGDPSSETWFNYDPASAIGTIGSAATPTFTNVISVGVLFQVDATTTGNKTYEFTNFQAQASIPEPAHAAMLLGIVAFTGILIRRRRA